jgi:putative membrane protein
MRALPLTVGLVILAVAWLGLLNDLTGLAGQSFSAHMAAHMAVVALAAPLVALAVSGSAFDPAAVFPRLFAPVQASIVELVVVWTWHTPLLHHAARHEMWAFVLEQVSFLGAGLLLWIAAVGGDREQRRFRGAAGVVALLFTSMHMTLLGALFALAPRPLYPHLAQTPASQIADQHLGGAIMLIVGGLSYLAGGLWLTAGLLRPSGRGWEPERRGVSS